MDEVVGTLVVERPPAKWRDRLRRYVILVDAEEVGRLTHGESLSVLLPPGPHTLQARIDWTGSEAIEIDVKGGRETRCVVSAAGTLMSSRARMMTSTEWLQISIVDG